MDESEWEIKRRKARERRAARKARRKAEEERWRTLVDRHFHFLQTDYEFEIVKVDASWVWETVLVYQTPTVAVKVANSLEYDRAEVSLIRLVDGKIPPIQVFFFQDSVLNETLLDNLILRRAPDSSSRLHAMKGRTEEQLDATLAFLASTARMYASDVLGGDFSVFEEIQAERREYARQHPPKITVWGPATGSADQLAQAADEARKAAPGVEVEARLYGPPGESKGGNSDNTRGKAADPDERPPFGLQPSRP